MVSRIALALAAGVLLSGTVTPAKAADLGGGCCGDLEERVAELEATVARKGNRVVSLQVYGDITLGLLAFDNGEQSDVFIVDNDAIGSVLGFKGEATLKPGWKAGYKMEFAVQSAVSSLVTEDDDDAVDNFSIRHNYLYVESEKWGRFSIGQQSTTSDGAAEVSIANVLISASPDHGTSLSPGGVGAGLLLGDYASNFDGGRDDLVRYDSPTIYGFTASVAWGDNDYWDAALRFTKEYNSVKVAAAIAYADDQTSAIAGENFTQVIGSVAMLHVPTGLFANFATGDREFDAGDNASFYFVQGGLERSWLPYGTTTIYGEYGKYEDVTVNTEAELVGFGIVQHVDAAAMDIYAQARFWDIQDDLNVDADELSTIMIGSRISF